MEYKPSAKTDFDKSMGAISIKFNQGIKRIASSSAKEIKEFASKLHYKTKTNAQPQ